MPSLQTQPARFKLDFTHIPFKIRQPNKSCSYFNSDNNDVVIDSFFLLLLSFISPRKALSETLRVKSDVTCYYDTTTVHVATLFQIDDHGL